MRELLPDFRVVIELDLVWGDMDAFGHLNNVQYFRYYESARIRYFEKTGVIRMGEEMVIGPILASCASRFKAPLDYPDRLLVGARVERIERDRFHMRYAIASASLGRVAAEGESVVVAFDYREGRKCEVPAAWRARIAEVEGREFPDEERVSPS